MYKAISYASSYKDEKKIVKRWTGATLSGDNFSTLCNQDEKIQVKGQIFSKFPTVAMSTKEASSHEMFLTARLVLSHLTRQGIVFDVSNPENKKIIKKLTGSISYLSEKYGARTIKIPRPYNLNTEIISIAKDFNMSVQVFEIGRKYRHGYCKKASRVTYGL